MCESKKKVTETATALSYGDVYIRTLPEYAPQTVERMLHLVLLHLAFLLLFSKIFPSWYR